MKHYTKFKGDEIDLIGCRKWMGKNADTAGAKRGYRRRERAVLKEMLLAEVAESDNDRIYWERELDAAVCEWLNLADEDRYDSEFHEVYGWDGYDADWYEMRYAEMRKRVHEAENELAALAA